MERHPGGRLRWPGCEFAAVRLERGWVAVRFDETLSFGLEPDPQGQLFLPETRAVAVRGERLASLRALRDHTKERVAIAYVDVPRISVFDSLNPQLQVSTWLSMLRSHAQAAFSLLATGGRLVLHSDDEGAALARALMDDLLGPDGHEVTILWQKKYSPQNDLKGRIDDAHDFLFVYSRRGERKAPPGSGTWWNWQKAGKSEDATKEVERLRDNGIVKLVDIPKTSKPEKLLKLLLESFSRTGEILLEMFSDTGFAAAAALKAGRRAILLGGATAREVECFEKCSRLRLEDVADKGTKPAAVRVFGAESIVVPQPAKVSAKGQPLRYEAGTAAGAGHGHSTPGQLRPLMVERHGDEAPKELGFPSMTVLGPPTDTLSAAASVVRCEASYAWIEVGDAPREDGVHFDQWIGNVRGLLERAPALLAADGALAMRVRDGAYAPVRLLAEEVLGREQYVGSVALEPPVSKGNLDQHEFVIVFRALETEPKKVGLPSDHVYTNPDVDPRGPWRDPGYKDARSGGPSLAFPIRVPPYRWELVGGELPGGIWRVNPVTGVLWGPKLLEEGKFCFRVRVSDSGGRSTEATCEIEVNANVPYVSEASVWFLDELPRSSSGPPRITNLRLPRGTVGHVYHAVLRAEGGAPYANELLPGKAKQGGERTRYWGFARDTLVRAVLEDRVHFGTRGQSRPSIKKYPSGRRRRDIQVELSWWERERLGGEPPEERLVRIFSDPGALVVSIPAAPGRFTARAIELGRRTVEFLPEDATGKALHTVARLGPPTAVRGPDPRSFHIEYESPDFENALAWLEGFLPIAVSAKMGRLPVRVSSLLTGASPDGSEGLVIFKPDDWPTPGRCQEIAEFVSPHFVRVYVYYYRGQPPRGMRGCCFRRIPFELTCRR